MNTPMAEQAASSITVGISEMAVTKTGGARIITHALGSCLGIAIYDPVGGVAGLAHIQLPLSKIDVQKAEARPCMFVDTGVPALFMEAYRLGAVKKRIQLKVAGGAQFMDSDGKFKIGERNFTILRKILWKNDVLIAAQDVGGSISRTMSVDVDAGEVTIKSGLDSWTL